MWNIREKGRRNIRRKVGKYQYAGKKGEDNKVKTGVTLGLKTK